MKANEAPERIILSADRDTKKILDEWVVNDYTDNIKIEYIRTDTFIEKTCEWLRNNSHNYANNALGKEYLINDFKSYMKGG